MDIHILDLDGTLPTQLPIARRLGAGQARLHDLRHFGPSLRLWCSAFAYDAFVEHCRAAQPARGPTLTLFGSGDFHHLTASFLATAPGPLTVVHFDNHPDWCHTVPRRHCGSWVNDALSLPHVRRVITLGPCSDDLVRPDRKRANLAALSEGRLVVLPWRHVPSRVRVPVRPGEGHTVHDGVIHWRTLWDRQWADVLEDLAATIVSRRIWITIDKDVLGPGDAVTNWDQGDLPLDHLLAAIRCLAGRFDIVGADICGDYTPLHYGHPLKAIEARIDQRGRPRGYDLRVNARTNERLIATFEECLG